MLPEGCSRIDFRDPKIWKENDTYYLIVGNKNDNQVGQVVLCSSKNLTDWKFETILASNENGDIGTMWECPDFFALKDKHVLICSPQDMKARKYEFHNGHNSVYFLGDYDANRCRFSKEQPHTLDYGMDFYAPQTTELPDGRRIMIAWMKSWDACVIPNSQDWQGMMTFPRELEIKENRIWQNPVKELENYHQNPCCYEHAEIEGETVLAGVEGRTIDLTVTLEDGENTIFSINWQQIASMKRVIPIIRNQNFWKSTVHTAVLQKMWYVYENSELRIRQGLKRCVLSWIIIRSNFLLMMDSRRRPLQSVRL